MITGILEGFGYGFGATLGVLIALIAIFLFMGLFGEDPKPKKRGRDV